jgi:hypothetical protein
MNTGSNGLSLEVKNERQKCLWQARNKRTEIFTDP